MKEVPTQLDMRENTASSRRHALRLAVSPSSLRSESQSASEHEDAQSCERMPPNTEAFNLPLTEPEKGATGGKEGQRVGGSIDPTRQIVSLGRRPEFEPLLACGDAARILGNIHVKTLQRYARQGAVPGYRIGGHWYFRTTELDAWLQSRINSNCQSVR
jgi:excisionase family DNA binding protein